MTPSQKPQDGGAAVRYEPHCDCLGGHVSMVPDPNGRWCRADEGWQDISTARKDGTAILLWASGLDWKYEPIPSIGWWSPHLGWVGHSLIAGAPTHWRLLPEPPTPNATEADHA